MIDLNELRRMASRSIGITVSSPVSPAGLIEILDRLEAAEKAVTEAYQRGYATGQEESEKERDALRAKIEAMERQEPVASVWRCDNGHIHGSCERALPMGTKLYPAPGAKGEEK